MKWLSKNQIDDRMKWVNIFVDNKIAECEQRIQKSLDSDIEANATWKSTGLDPSTRVFFFTDRKHDDRAREIISNWEEIRNQFRDGTLNWYKYHDKGLYNNFIVEVLNPRADVEWLIEHSSNRVNDYYGNLICALWFATDVGHHIRTPFQMVMGQSIYPEIRLGFDGLLSIHELKNSGHDMSGELSKNIIKICYLNLERNIDRVRRIYKMKVRR